MVLSRRWVVLGFLQIWWLELLSSEKTRFSQSQTLFLCKLQAVLNWLSLKEKLLCGQTSGGLSSDGWQTQLQFRIGFYWLVALFDSSKTCIKRGVPRDNWHSWHWTDLQLWISTDVDQWISGAQPAGSPVTVWSGSSSLQFVPLFVPCELIQTLVSIFSCDFLHGQVMPSLIMSSYLDLPQVVVGFWHL